MRRPAEDFAAGLFQRRHDALTFAALPVFPRED
jgi:hypothetical protein